MNKFLLNIFLVPIYIVTVIILFHNLKQSGNFELYENIVYILLVIVPFVLDRFIGVKHSMKCHSSISTKIIILLCVVYALLVFTILIFLSTSYNFWDPEELRFALCAIFAFGLAWKTYKDVKSSLSH